MSSSQVVNTSNLRSNSEFPVNLLLKRKAIEDYQHKSKKQKICFVTPFSKQAPRCRYFPKCRMGQKCHFVHPKCKYNAACRNPKCAYVHVGPRKLELFDINNNVVNLYKWKKEEKEKTDEQKTESSSDTQ